MVPVAWLGVVIGVVGLALGASCSGKGGGGGGGGKASKEALARAEALAQEESDLLSRRDDLSRERKRVSDERAALAEKKKQVAAAGGDVKAVEQEEQALADKEQQLARKQSEFDKTLEGYMQKQSEVAAAAGGEVARREAGVAAREQGFARREETIARREADLAARERELAKREKETCGTGAVTTMVVQAPPSGSKYTKRDVEPLLQKAHRKMGEKGILSADLPPMAAGLEREATKAMAEGDYGKAKFAAEQLYASVDAVKIDKGFIAGKISRLNAAMKGTQLADAARKEVDDLFRGATGDYGDGKFTAANGKLNKIYALIR